MAQSLVFSFAESLLGKLATAAVQEASLALGVHRQLQQMKATTALIKAVLLDAEQKNPKSSALSEWLIQVKRVFSDAEDIVDDFECEALRKHVVNTYGSCSTKVRRFFSTSNPVVYRLRMAHHIQDINTRLAKLADQRIMFGLQIIHHDTRVVQLREMTHSHVNPSNVTGREDDKNEIVKLLDSEFTAVEVCVLWGALGFLPPPKQDESMTDIATLFLHELWTRSFLLDFVDLGGDCYFKLHDLVSDLAAFVGKGKLATVAVQEASLALGVRSELKEMKETMEIIRGVLLDAQQKTLQSTALSEWLKRVKRVFSDAEDIVGDFECEALRKHVVNTSGSHSMKVRRFFSSSNPVVYRLRMAHRIQDINTRLAKLADQRNMFGLQIINQDTRVVHEGESMSDVLNKVLCELRTRSFLSDDLDFGIDNVYQIHDLVSDLAVYIGKGEFERVNRRNPKISENAQHLVFEENSFYGEDLLPIGLRSVVFRDGGSNIDFLNALVSRCRYLRILDLRYSEYESLPHCIGKLKHLRFLCLAKNEKLKELPDSVCKLQNLKTLVLSGCIRLQKLPKGIKYLISLRHLAITTAQTDFSKEEIANFTSLENLSFTQCDNLESLFEEVQLSTLQTLTLIDCGNLKSVSLHAIRNLEALTIINCNKLESLSCQIPELKLKFKPKVGQDWHKISHIKQVDIDDSDDEEDLSE
ncbi:disease resistance protein RPM1 [Vigna unguiculata]|uniref:Disease resistance protein RPM1 n=1 Tax=Vigna unguiculata TaxID=3917 RepID=A0A4D6MX92_VIGUN|nr:disease resistance protein RPM1 [Vigna unguiculata]